MCGICAVFNKNGLNQDNLLHFTKMLESNYTRGEDSTGIALQSLDYLKSATPSYDYVKTQDFQDFLDKALGQQWILGHTRRSTRGNPEILENDHPIRGKKPFLLAHNGVVGTNKIPVSYSKTDTYIIVDSVDKHFKNNDLESTLRSAYKEFWGSSTTITVTKNQFGVVKRINPIFRGDTTDGGVAFASELAVLYANNLINNYNENGKIDDKNYDDYKKFGNEYTEKDYNELEKFSSKVNEINDDLSQLTDEDIEKLNKFDKEFLYNGLDDLYDLENEFDSFKDTTDELVELRNSYGSSLNDFFDEELFDEQEEFGNDYISNAYEIDDNKYLIFDKNGDVREGIIPHRQTPKSFAKKNKKLFEISSASNTSTTTQ